jgi:hypothetical protein
MPYRNCRDLLFAEYDSDLEGIIRESDVALTPSVSTLVTGNGARIWIQFSNTGSNNAIISTASNVSGIFGVLLAPGGILKYHFQQDNDLPTLAFYAVTTPGFSGQVHITEYVLTGSGN